MELREHKICENDRSFKVFANTHTQKKMNDVRSAGRDILKIKTNITVIKEQL